jgi:hypothetical protein
VKQRAVVEAGPARSFAGLWTRLVKLRAVVEAGPARKLAGLRKVACEAAGGRLGRHRARNFAGLRR